MKKAVFLLACAAAVVVAVVFSGGAADPKQVGYFNSAERDRVMAYAAPPGMTAREAEAFLSSAMTTPGRITVAVIYRPGGNAPGARLTAAPDLATALQMIATPPHDGWAWRLRVNPAGRRTFDGS